MFVLFFNLLDVFVLIQFWHQRLDASVLQHVAHVCPLCLAASCQSGARNGMQQCPPGSKTTAKPNHQKSDE